MSDPLLPEHQTFTELFLRVVDVEAGLELGIGALSGRVLRWLVEQPRKLAPFLLGRRIRAAADQESEQQRIWPEMAQREHLEKMLRRGTAV